MNRIIEPQPGAPVRISTTLPVWKPLFLLLSFFMTAGTISAQLPVHAWSAGAGGSGMDQGKSIATDRYGHAYVTGTFQDSIVLGDTVLRTGTSSTDIFAARFDASGHLIWATQLIRNPSNLQANNVAGIAVNDSGSVYIALDFYNIINISPGAASFTASGTTSDILICKLDAAGDYVWGKQIRGQNASVKGLALDPVENILITGSFSDSADFDPDTSATAVLKSNGNNDVFVGKYSSSGDLIWARSFGGNNNDFGRGIASDAHGRVYTTGVFRTTVDFDPGSGEALLTVTGTSSGSNSDAFVSVLDAQGNYVWAGRIGSSGADQGAAIGLDPQGSIYVAGYFASQVVLNPSAADPDTLKPVGSKNLFVVKLDDRFSLLWAKRIGGTVAGGSVLGIEPYGLAVDPAGDVYISGFYSGTMDFDPDDTAVHNHTAASMSELYLLKLNGAGNYEWSGSVGGTTITNSGYGLAIANSGDIFMTGVFNATANFDISGTGSRELTSNGGNGDAFVVRYINCIMIPEDPVAVLSGPDSVCADGSYWYSVATLPGAARYEWILSPGMSGSSDSNRILIHFTDRAGNISVRALGNCDTGKQFSQTIRLTMDPVTITADKDELGTASRNYQSWQWYLDGNAIPKAGDPVITVTENGRYSVVVSLGDCTDTAHYHVTNVSVTGAAGTAGPVLIYPNPVHDRLYVTAPVHITISSTDGQVVMRHSNAGALSLSGIADGVYIVRITDLQGNLLRTEKLVKKSR